MDGCIFCKILKGEIPCAKVYEDDRVMAFLDIMPINKGHTLVVPKKHSANMLEDSVEDLYAIIHAVKKIAPAVIKSVDADGFNLGVNTKEAAGQVVMHTHFHIIPRFSDDGLKHWPQKKYEDGEMDKFKESIMNAI